MSEVEISFFGSAIKEFGPLVCLIGYYVWRDFITAKQNVLREMRLSDRVTQLEDFQRNELTTTVKQVTGSMTEFVATVRAMPCLMERNLDFTDEAPHRRRAGG